MDGIRGAALFEGVVRKAIHELKYRGRTALALPLAELIVHVWGNGLFPVDCLVYVPLHPRRLRERGYNQAALITEGLTKEIRLPILTGALVRSRMTEAQTKLGARERQRNVAGAFSARPQAVDGRSIMLVDDVCTTGSTLQACADALRAAGADQVYAMTVARADWDARTGATGDTENRYPSHSLV